MLEARRPTRIVGADKIAPGKHTIDFDFQYDGGGLGKGGLGTLTVDGAKAAESRIERTSPVGKFTLETHSFDLAALKTKPTTIYLCLPARHIGTCNRWLRLFVNLTLQSMEQTRGPLPGGVPVLCVLDEFASLGHLQQVEDAAGQIATTHSVSAGLDYPAIGPEHAWLADQRRAQYAAVSDTAALDAARLLARKEGIIPALESAHAIAGLIERAPQLAADDLVIVNLSGRGDKDMGILARELDLRGASI